MISPSMSTKEVESKILELEVFFVILISKGDYSK
jgi:hypothetical protein